MRKRIITPTPVTVQVRDEGALDVQHAATVELTSEDEEYPIESAFTFEEGRGWRAMEPGAQTIRLIFDEPQRIKRIQLIFEEQEHSRTQEFVLRWSADGGNSFKEIVRQQWNFSPGSKRETEDYRVELLNATVIELRIVPDTSGGLARASLKSMRLS